MKIILISHQSHIQGGAQGVLIDLIKGLKLYQPNLEIYIIFPHYGNLIDICSPYINGYKIIKQPWWIVPKGQSSWPIAVGRFFRILKYSLKTLKYFHKIQPDIIITNTLASPVAALAAYWGHFKHIWLLHEIPTMSTNSGFLYSEKIIIKYIEKFSLELWAVSNSILQYYKKFLSNLKKIHRIHYAIEIPPINNIKHNIYTLIMVGTFDDNKGQKEAIHACNIVKNNYHIPFQLLLIGANNTSYEKEAKELIDKYKLTKEIQIISFTPNIFTYYEQADVLIMCSASEGLPRVIVESQKIGIPTIATNIPAHHELITHKENGLLYHRGNINELAQCIVQLSNQTMQKQMGHNARKKIQNIYTLKDFIHEVTNRIDKYV